MSRSVNLRKPISTARHTRKTVRRSWGKEGRNSTPGAEPGQAKGNEVFKHKPKKKNSSSRTQLKGLILGVTKRLAKMQELVGAL